MKMRVREGEIEEGALIEFPGYALSSSLPAVSILGIQVIDRKLMALLDFSDPHHHQSS
jgi:hypothetical protein